MANLACYTKSMFIEHNSYDNHPWIIKLVEYTRKAIDHNRVKILGICFGHQIIARASGMKVGKSGVGWEIAVCDMDLSDQGKEVFGKEKLVGCLLFRFSCELLDPPKGLLLSNHC